MELAVMDSRAMDGLMDLVVLGSGIAEVIISIVASFLAASSHLALVILPNIWLSINGFVLIERFFRV
ncbi:hypothetical protein BKA61DRAFT_298759 [Leptodontidium sp. MPI-SDFR-AT-0119]|nr:hypothetical protein BKA61DRAFT_298759 [Leptodontidium sp. MPI-SDFR-AT-0119]